MWIAEGLVPIGGHGCADTDVYWRGGLIIEVDRRIGHGAVLFRAVARQNSVGESGQVISVPGAGGKNVVREVARRTEESDKSGRVSVRPVPFLAFEIPSILMFHSSPPREVARCVDGRTSQN